MQGAHTSNDSQSSSLFASALAASHSLITPKRVGFTVAGAFVFVGAAAALSGNAGSQDGAATPRSITVQSSASDPAQPEASASDQQTSANQVDQGAASSSNSTNIQVNVNGQTIAVPDNGSVQKTVPTADGNGQSSVSVDSSNNGSSSSVNLNVSSSSASTGSSSGGFSSSSTIVTQNGGTTFISNN